MSNSFEKLRDISHKQIQSWYYIDIYQKQIIQDLLSIYAKSTGFQQNNEIKNRFTRSVVM